MRSRATFSDKPKRTPEDRRCATEPEWLTMLSRLLGAEYRACVASVTRTEAEKASCGYERRAFLLPWMKRSEYLRAYDAEIRRGKWRDRRERGRQKRKDRAFAKWLPMAATTCAKAMLHFGAGLAVVARVQRTEITHENTSTVGA